MVGFYNYTVILTYFSLASSVCGIFLAFRGNITAAVVCLLISGLCDMFDGKVARTKKDRTDDEKAFGIQIDSLCDLVCFNVLPVVIGISIGATAIWQMIIGIGFVLVGVIRLGYFNVIESNRQAETTEKRKVYPGMPVTLSSLFIPLLMCFSKLLGNALPVVYSFWLLGFGFCEIGPFKIRRPGKVGSAIMIAFGTICLIICVIVLR